jgi:hypothetical protein
MLDEDGTTRVLSAVAEHNLSRCEAGVRPNANSNFEDSAGKGMSQLVLRRSLTLGVNRNMKENSTLVQTLGRLRITRRLLL